MSQITREKIEERTYNGVVPYTTYNVLEDGKYVMSVIKTRIGVSDTAELLVYCSEGKTEKSDYYVKRRFFTTGSEDEEKVLKKAKLKHIKDDPYLHSFDFGLGFFVVEVEA